MPSINLSILNQKATPSFFADTLANRPAPSFVGRVFISTDTYDLYRDTGTAWVLLSPSSTGTIGGSGTTDTIPLFSSTSSITNSVITQQTGAQSITIGSLATPFNVVGYGNYYGTKFIINGGLNTQILVADGTTITAGTGISISGGQISATSSGGVTGTGAAGQVSFWSGASSISGSNNLFWDNVQGHLGIGTITPGTALDIHHNQNTIAQFNQTTFGNDSRIAFQSNGIANWRIGNFYNLGANDFGVYDVLNSLERFSVKTTGQTFVGAQTSSSGLFNVNSANSDNHICVIGANAPSIRVRNAGSGASYQFGIGLATTTNNFIQGTTLGEMCIFNDSLFDSPILFGIRTSISGLTNEVGRFAANGNFGIGTSTPTGAAGLTLAINGNINQTRIALKNSFTGDSSGDGFQIALDAGSADVVIENREFGILRFATNGTELIRLKPTSVINFSNVPTSPVGLVTGDIYSSAGVLMIV